MESAHQVFHAIEPVFERYKNSDHVECEVRLGRFTGNRFDANIGKTHWTTIVKCLEAYKDWESKSETGTEVYYKNSIRLVVNEDTEEQELYEKKRIQNVELKLKGRPLDARFSVSTETPIDPETCQGDDEWDEVRCRQRKSFIRKNLRIDCTVVNGGAVDPDAEDDTEYQVEMEILDPKKVGDRDTAFNIFYKLQDILNTIK
tara:strand:- start:3216 stop:3821 length:606 start_codon:yes stop_codon:yes gene_type:complete